MQPSINPFSIPKSPGIYILGCFESRVTLFSQQVRALDLSYQLIMDKTARPGDRVAVVGAGGAGLTAATALAASLPTLAAVDVYEQKPDIMHFQHASERFLHPHLYDWPAAGSERESAGLPLLEWTAGKAEMVAETLEAEFWQAQRSLGCLQLHKCRAVLSVEASSPRGAYVRFAGGDEHYDIVILAVGFGVEKPPTPSYWNRTALVGPLRVQANEPDILISGTGDGGLVDFLLAAFDRREHQEICELITNHGDLDAIKQVLLDIEARAWASDEKFDILLAYRNEVSPLLTAELLNDIKAELRPNANVFLHARDALLFKRESAILNRFAVVLAQEADRSRAVPRLHFVTGTILVSPKHARILKFKDGRSITPSHDHRYFRYGPDAKANLRPFSRLANEFRKCFAKPTGPAATPELPAAAKAYFVALAASNPALQPLTIPARTSDRHDRVRLRLYSGRTHTLLHSLSFISLGAKDLRISRRCVNQLSEAAAAGHLLVVGEPGAGKSAALHAFIEQADLAGGDVVYLAADRLNAEALSTQLGVGGPLDEVLARWGGDGPAYLVIDGLDAARDERLAQMLTDLIKLVIEARTRWKVVASIRTFDLQNRADLQALFPNQPSDGLVLGDEFARVRYLKIPVFSDEELAQLVAQAKPLAAAWKRMPGRLHELLRVPFNLRLFVDLMNESKPSSLVTQEDLLELYWNRRILGDSSPDEAELLLFRACKLMLDNRSLQVNRLQLLADAPRTVLQRMLSNRVLKEWLPPRQTRPDRYRVEFSHNLLFDYAVARLLLGPDDKALEDALRQPQDFLFLRPALVQHFRQLWHRDLTRRPFWECVLRIANNPELPGSCKVIGPGVAAELARTQGDLEPLMEGLLSTQQGAQESLRLACTVLVAFGQRDNTGTLWCRWLVELLQSPIGTNWAWLATYVLTWATSARPMSPALLEAAGAASRLLFELTRGTTRWPAAVKLLCRTIASDVTTHTRLLEAVLAHEELAKTGYLTLQALFNEYHHLLAASPELVLRVYEAAFVSIDYSESRRPMDDSQVQIFLTTPLQDVETIRSLLADAFPEVLTKVPDSAGRFAVQTFSRWWTTRWGLATPEMRLLFDGHTYDTSADGWLSSIDEGDNEVKMFLAVEAHLRADVNPTLLLKRIHALAGANTVEVFWRHLEVSAMHDKGTFGTVLRPHFAASTWTDLRPASPMLTPQDTTLQSTSSSARRLEPPAALEVRFAQLQPFISRSVDDKLTRAELERIIEEAVGLECELQAVTADPGWRHARLLDLTHVYVIAARDWDGSLGSDLRNRLRDSLIRLAQEPARADEERLRARFEKETVTYYRPRSRAADGLLFLSRFAPEADHYLLILSRDDDPSVRLAVAMGLGQMSESQRAQDIVAEMSVHENSPRIALALVRTLTQAFTKAPWIRASMEALTERIADEALRGLCLGFAFNQYVMTGDSNWEALVLRWATTGTASGKLPNAAMPIRICLMSRGVSNRPPAVRTRAFRLARTLAERAREAMCGGQSSEIGLQLGDLLASQLFFACEPMRRSVPLSPDDDRLFAAGAYPIIHELAKVGAPHISHDLVQTLEKLAAIDPREAILSLAEVLKATPGYGQESLGEGVVMRLITYYLTEHRQLLQGDKACCAALLATLDTFLDYGWVQAVRIVYQLEEIYR